MRIDSMIELKYKRKDFTPIFLFRIIRSLYRRGGLSRKTPCMFGTNLNWETFTRYLALAIEDRLIVVEGNGLKLTPLGYKAYNYACLSGLFCREET